MFLLSEESGDQAWIMSSLGFVYQSLICAGVDTVDSSRETAVLLCRILSVLPYIPSEFTF